MPNASESRRRELLADLLPFFRLCADDALVVTVLRETADLADDDFERAAKAALRGDTQGNPIERLRALARRGKADGPAV